RSTAFSDTSWESSDRSESEGCCQHKCFNKSTCLHICCKKGLNTDSAHSKQVTKNKRQQNAGEKTDNSAKKPKQCKPNSNLDNWLKTAQSKDTGNSGQQTAPNTSNTSNAVTKSQYFTDNKYADIESEDIEDTNSTFNDSFDDLMCNLEDSIDVKPNVESMDKPVDMEFDRQLDAMFSCTEDFQDFSEAIEVKCEPIEPSSGGEPTDFLMSQWSLFIPNIDLKGKTFLRHN
ncbi:unnamed protein product, partial [Oppiella nova]